MSSFRVISGVTKTLSEFLKTATGLAVDHTHSPDQTIPDANSLIHIYLYRVEVNPFFANAEPLRPTPVTVQESPIGLNLLYLFTPYGPDQIEIQVTLGEIIKVFNDTPIIPPSAFDADLVGTTEELRVIPRSIELETLTDFWRSFEQRSYRLCLAYEVATVLIDAAGTRTITPVDERHVKVGQLR